MSEELNVESKNKLNKKFLLFAIIGIAVATIVAIASIVPTSVRAKEVQEQLSLGDKYLAELNYEQAEVSYLAVLEIDPKCEDAYIRLVNVYMITGQYEKAEEILEKAVAQLGETEGIKQKREELEREKAEKLKPTSTPVPTATSTPKPTPTNTPVPTKKVEQYDFGGVTVKLWGDVYNNLDKEEGDDNYEIWEEIKTAVEEKYNIKLEKAVLEGHDGGNEDDILIASIKTGSPVAHIMNLNPSSMVTCFMNDILFDLTPYLDVLQVGSAYTNMGKWQDKVYGISYENIGDTWLLIYDRNYLKEIGIEKTPTDMFMEGKWSYADCKQYLTQMKAKLPSGVYPIGAYPYHWGVMSASANGVQLVDTNGKLNFMDDAVIEANEFYKELIEEGLAFPCYVTRNADGTVYSSDLAYAVDDTRIVLKRAEIWQLGGLDFEYGVCYYPWGSNVTCTGDYTTLSDNYRTAMAYWGIDSVVKAAVEETGIPGEILAKIAQDIRYLNNPDRAKVWHGSWVEEQENPNYQNLGMEVGEPRNFYTEQDITLFDWAHSRAVPDLSWTFDDAGLIDCWKPFQLIFAEGKALRSTLQSYYNSGIAALKEVGFENQ